LFMLAHPPNPNPTTSTHTTINVFTTYMTVQLGRKSGGFSAALYIHTQLTHLNVRDQENKVCNRDTGTI
jgi:hypothetical protein